jgi:plastocyanin
VRGRRLRQALWGALLAAGAWASLSGSVSASPRAVVVQIVIDQIAFQRPDVAASVGDTVEWVNRDVVDHAATARSGAWDVLIPAGKKARLVLTQPGTFEYYCRFHPDMTARLTVSKARP